MASNKKHRRKPCADTASAPIRRPLSFLDVTAMAAVILFTLCMGISAISGWVVAKGENYGVIPLSLYLGCAGLAYLAAIAEFLLRKISLSPFVLRVVHFGVTALIYYVYMSILSGTGSVAFNLLSAPGMIISFLLLVTVYFAFYGVFRLISYLKRVLPTKWDAVNTAARGFVIFSAFSLIFLIYAASYSLHKGVSDIGMHLLQFSVFLVFALVAALALRFTRKGPEIIRWIALWACTLLWFGIGVILLDSNALFPFKTTAERFVAFAIITLLYWAFIGICYGIRALIFKKSGKKISVAKVKKQSETKENNKKEAASEEYHSMFEE